MPYAIKKNKNGTFRVMNKDTGAIKSKHTTKKRALAQIRLLYLIENKPNAIHTIYKKFNNRTNGRNKRSVKNKSRNNRSSSGRGGNHTRRLRRLR